MPEGSKRSEPGELVLDFAELARDPSSTKLDLTNYVDYVYSGASGIVKPEDMVVDLGINNWSVLLTPSARLQAYVKIQLLRLLLSRASQKICRRHYFRSKSFVPKLFSIICYDYATI